MMSPALSENLPIILIVAAIVIALLWWLMSRRSPDSAQDLPATSTPLDTIEEADTGIGDVARSIAAEFTTVAPAPPTPKSKTPSAKSVVRKPASKKAVAASAEDPFPAAAKKPRSASVMADSTAEQPSAVPPKTRTPKADTVKIAPDDIAVIETVTPKVAATDNIGLLKGVGPKLITLLQSMGVTRLEQIASWSEADIADIDGKLGNFAGRIRRDNWVDQAKLLSSGDVAGFEQKYGALGSAVK